jgi:hypothetical protein
MSFTLRGEINGDVLQNGVRTAERSDFSTMEIVPPYGTFRPFGKGDCPTYGTVRGSPAGGDRPIYGTIRIPDLSGVEGGCFPSITPRAFGKGDCPTYGTVRGSPAGGIVPYMGQSGFPNCLAQRRSAFRV